MTAQMLVTNKKNKEMAAATHSEQNIRNMNSGHTKHSQRFVNISKLAIGLLPNAEELIDEIDACSEAPQDEAPHQPFILVPSCQMALYEQEER